MRRLHRLWPEDIADYQADIDSATDSLIGVQFDLQTAERNAEERIQDATEDLDTAQADYNGVFVKWLGMNIALHYGQSPDAILAAYNTDLESIFGESRIREIMSQFEDGGLEDNPATPWNEAVVITWAVFYPGDILVDCGNLEPGPYRACIRDEFLDAYDVVEELAADLETIQAEESEKIRKANRRAVHGRRLVGASPAIPGRLFDRSVRIRVDRVRSQEQSRSPGSCKGHVGRARRRTSPISRPRPTRLNTESKQQDIVLAETRLAESLETLNSLTGATGRVAA